MFLISYRRMKVSRIRFLHLWKSLELSFHSVMLQELLPCIVLSLPPSLPSKCEFYLSLSTFQTLSGCCGRILEPLHEPFSAKTILLSLTLEKCWCRKYSFKNTSKTREMVCFFPISFKLYLLYLLGFFPPPALLFYCSYVLVVNHHQRQKNQALFALHISSGCVGLGKSRMDLHSCALGLVPAQAVAWRIGGFDCPQNYLCAVLLSALPDSWPEQ